MRPTLLAASIALALWIGARAVHEGRLTPGDLLLFFHYALALRGPLVDFAGQTARLGRTYACAHRLEKVASSSGKNPRKNHVWFAASEDTVSRAHAHIERVGAECAARAGN